LTQADHRSKHSKYHAQKVNCSRCKKSFVLNATQVSNRTRAIRMGRCKTGPFCSRYCSGKINN